MPKLMLFTGLFIILLKAISLRDLPFKRENTARFVLLLQQLIKVTNINFYILI